MHRNKIHRNKIRVNKMHRIFLHLIAMHLPITRKRSVRCMTLFRMVIWRSNQNLGQIFKQNLPENYSKRAKMAIRSM